jgi:FixJ family two-component response regulator
MTTVVHLIDDDVSIRGAIGRFLKASGLEVQSYRSAGEYLKRRSDGGNPSCIVLDYLMPGLTGLEFQEQLAHLGSTLPIVFLTGHGTVRMTVQAMKAGAEDFLTKPVSGNELLDAIRRAIEKYVVSRDHNTELHSLRRRIGRLTPRESQVFELVVQGKLNKQIAYELGTTERTIKAHRHRVMKKTQVRSLAELVSIAERLGKLSTIFGAKIAEERE